MNLRALRRFTGVAGSLIIPTAAVLGWRFGRHSRLRRAATQLNLHGVRIIDMKGAHVGRVRHFGVKATIRKGPHWWSGRHVHAEMLNSRGKPYPSHVYRRLPGARLAK